MGVHGVVLASGFAAHDCLRCAAGGASEPQAENDVQSGGQQASEDGPVVSVAVEAELPQCKDMHIAHGASGIARNLPEQDEWQEQPYDDDVGVKRW